MESVVGPLLVFVLGGGFVVGLYFLATWLPGALLQQRLEDRMTDVFRGTDPKDATVASILKGQAGGVLPALDNLAGQTRYGSWLARLIDQAGVKMGVSSLLLAAAACGAMAAVIAATAFHQGWAMIPAAGVGLVAPVGVLLHRRSRRLAAFEEQFPEALDLLSRAIRAGHAFQTAMGMVADECPDPCGPEFKKTFDEQNYGLPLKDALNGMSARIPLLDVRFFVTAVLIQRETGGNLSEILDNLAHVVRERFKILRQVRVHTAHGRLTGYVLLALPAALMIALSFINPDHVALLFNEKMGRMMLCGAVVMQTVGYLWIRQVVKIEV